MASSISTDFSEIVIHTEPESGLKKNPKLTRSLGMKMLSIQAFMGLLKRIRSRRRPFGRAEPEADVYNRLMDDLEDEEEEEGVVDGSRRWWAKVYVVGEVVLFLVLAAAVVVTRGVVEVNKHTWWLVDTWQWLTLVMVLLTGLRIVRCATLLVLTPVKRRWGLHRYVVYVVEEIKWSVDVTLWFGLVLVIWCLWFRTQLILVRWEALKVVVHQTTGLLISLVLGSFLWALKNMLYLKLKADLHYVQLFDRIQQTVIDFHGIQIIYHEGMWKFLTSPANMIKGTQAHLTNKEEREAKECKGNVEEEDGKSRKEEEKKERTKGKNIWIDVCRMNKETVPIWIIRRLAAIYMKQMKKVGLPHNRDATADEQKLVYEAQQMLRGITRHDQRSDILPKDLDKYGLEEDERDYLFGLFETQNERIQRKLQIEASHHTSQNRVITRDQFLSWAVVTYKNCWGLKHTICSSKRVFIKLNRILSTFLLTLMVIVSLLLSKVVDSGQLALLFTPFLAASFIFGDSCRKMFEGLVFTFAMHPFDVGDRVVIDNVQMKVTQLNILTSVFFKYDTGEEVVYPNSLLTSTKIINLDITPDQADSLEFTIPSSTPLEVITDLEIKIKKALDDDITYSSQTKVAKKEITKDEIKMAVYFKYLVSYLGAETKAMHRSRILSRIMEFSKEMEINVLKASSAFEVGRVNFILDVKVTMEQIHELKRKMFEDGTYESYKEHSNVLMKGLDNNNIEMIVYIRRKESEESKDSKEAVERLKQHIMLEIKSLNGRLKDHEAWSHRLLEVGSWGRTSEKGASDYRLSSTKHHI